ncbi:hypothetical protein [Streptomyces sp. IB201691-2A2]|uniref:hypothetical protein n=1 Tax=Streptomyces sp. IB201691-2A2 TaxID=2561920 RepID=UPI00117D7D38|nr:hypothetical protein [Streptomyces sp. IB201691-2A2]
MTTIGELAAVPSDTPLILADQVVARPELKDGVDVTETIVVHPLHLEPTADSTYAEPAAPDNHDGPHPVMPALGLTMVRATRDQDVGAEFEHSVMQPSDRLARAEVRLSKGELEGGTLDAADAIELVAHYLAEGSSFIPSDHAAHTTVGVEISRLRHTADRLRKAAPGAQEASGQ